MYTDPSGEIIDLALFLVGSYFLGAVFWGQQSDGSFDWNKANKGGLATMGMAGSMIASIALPGLIPAGVGALPGLMIAGGQFASTAINTGAWSWMTTGTFTPNWKASAFSAMPGLIMAGIGGVNAMRQDGNFFTGKGIIENPKLAYGYVVGRDGSITRMPGIQGDMGGADLHFYWYGEWVDNGTGFIGSRLPFIVAGNNTINSFRFWQSAASTIAVFNVPATGLTGYFLEPKGPSTRVPLSNQRIMPGTYDIRPHWREVAHGRYSLQNPNLLGERGGIVIHRGIGPGSTRGCLLPGYGWGVNRVDQSKEMLDALHLILDRTHRMRMSIFEIF